MGSRHDTRESNSDDHKSAALPLPAPLSSSFMKPVEIRSHISSVTDTEEVPREIPFRLEDIEVPSLSRSPPYDNFPSPLSGGSCDSTATSTDRSSSQHQDIAGPSGTPENQEKECDDPSLYTLERLLALFPDTDDASKPLETTSGAMSDTRTQTGKAPNGTQEDEATQKLREESAAGDGELSPKKNKKRALEEASKESKRQKRDQSSMSHSDGKTI